MRMRCECDGFAKSECECDANATALRNLDANAMRMRRIRTMRKCENANANRIMRNAIFFSKSSKSKIPQRNISLNFKDPPDAKYGPFRTAINTVSPWNFSKIFFRECSWMMPGVHGNNHVSARLLVFRTTGG